MNRLPFTMIVLATAVQLSPLAQAEDVRNKTGVATDTSGTVYLLDNASTNINWSHCIRKFDPDGKQQPELLTGLPAVSLTVDKDKDIYLIARGDVLVGRSADGYKRFLGAFSQMVQEPVSIAVDKDQNIYVADKKAGKILKCTQTRPRPDVASVKNPEGVAVDRTGAVYFTGEKQVWKAIPESNGYKVKAIVTTGLENPAGIVVDRNDNVFVADTGAGTITNYSSNGDLQRVVATKIDKLGAIAVAGDTLYFMSGQELLKYAPSSKQLSSNDKSFLGYVPLRGTDIYSSVAVDSKNNVYVTADHRVQKFDPEGNHLNDVASNIPGSAAGVTVDSNDNVFFDSYHANAVWKATRTSSSYDLSEFASGLNHPVGIAAGNDGRVFVADSDNWLVRAYGADSSKHEIQAYVPWAVASKDNYIFLSERGGVLKATWNSSSRSYVVEPFLMAPLVTGQQIGLALDAQGNVYVADPADATINRYKPNGKLDGPVALGLASRSIAVNTRGELYAITVGPDPTNDALWKILRAQVLFK